MMDRNKVHNLLKSRLECLIKSLSIDVDDLTDRYVGCCPIHGGDGNTAFTINMDKDYYGLWTCWSHNDHVHFGRDLYGLVWGVLSHREGWAAPGDPEVESTIVEQWIGKFLENSNETISVNRTIREKYKVKTIVPKFSKKMLTEVLTVPSPYYSIDQPRRPRYSNYILNKYCIGDCTRFLPDPLSSLYNRAVVPIFNDKEEAIAFSGRSLLPQCNHCELYHTGICPPKKYPSYVKWRHLNLTSSNTLYNYYENIDWFKDKKTCILVESPGNCLRLEDAGIRGGVGTFGAKLSEGQAELLARAGVNTLLVLFDADEAGFKGFKRISYKYKKDFNVVFPTTNLPPGTDLGNFPTSIVRNNIRKVLARYGNFF